MKRFYLNMSNETMKYRTWILTKENLDESDFLWLKSLNIGIRIEHPSHTFDTTNGGKRSIYGKRTVTLDSTTDKQRTMILLKYGDDAVLIQEEIVFPGSMSTCTLSSISW